MIDINFLKTILLFKALPEKTILSLSHSLQILPVNKGQIIFRENAKATTCYVIYRGKFKAIKTSSHGKEQILRFLKKGDLLGEVPMFAGGKYPASCKALTNGTLLALSRENLLKLIEQEPKIALNMLAIQAKKLKAFTEQIENLTLQDAKQRIAQYLLTLAKFYESESFKLDVSMTELANHLGLARENVSRILRQFDKNKWIQYSKKKIQILNSKALIFLLT